MKLSDECSKSSSVSSAKTEHDLKKVSFAFETHEASSFLMPSLLSIYCFESLQQLRVLNIPLCPSDIQADLHAASLNLFNSCRNHCEVESDLRLWVSIQMLHVHAKGSNESKLDSILLPITQFGRIPPGGRQDSPSKMWRAVQS